MSKKLPLEIRKNYTVKEQKTTWTLTCDVCGKAWPLNKPEKGKTVHGDNVLHLLDHAATHPLPEDDVAAPPKQEPVPVSQVQKKSKYCYPSPQTPHPYKVAIHDNVTKVSYFKPPHYLNPLHVTYCDVSKEDGGHSVLLYAANPKHATLIGERLIEKYLIANRRM